MFAPEVLILLITCLGLLGAWPFGSHVTAMSIGNQDLDRFFRSANSSSAIVEDRVLQDTFNMAFLNYTDLDNKMINYEEEQARYGEGKVLSVNGRLVHITSAEDVNDDTACSANILGTNGSPFPAEGWIALVQRGFCTFEVKVRNVHAKGAIGVIIYNDRETTHLEKMQIKGKNRNITAVITYQHIGKHMAEIADYGTDMRAFITKGGSTTRPINNLNRTSVLFVSISFIVLMVISLVWLIFYYIQRFRYLQNKDQQSRHLCSVTKKAIMKIPTKTGKSTDEKDLDSDCCAICIEAYKPSDCIRVLPCKHEFHKNCIDPWLIEHRTCPMCKLDVLKFYGYVVGDQIHSTPSPQHVSPPNLVATHSSDNEVVPVIVVAPSHHHQHHHQRHHSHSNHQHQHQQQHYQQHASASMPNSSSGGSESSSGGNNHGPAAHPNAITNNCSNSISNNCNSCSSSGNSNSYSCNSCSNNCNHSANDSSSSRNNCTNCTAATAAASASGQDEPDVRRNSAPVLQVSTASRQVTDV